MAESLSFESVDEPPDDDLEHSPSSRQHHHHHSTHKHHKKQKHKDKRGKSRHRQTNDLSQSHDEHRSRSHHRTHRSRGSHGNNSHNGRQNMIHSVSSGRVCSASPNHTTNTLSVHNDDSSHRSSSPRQDSFSSSTTEDGDLSGHSGLEDPDNMPRNGSLDNLTAYARKIRSETSGLHIPSNSLSSSTSTLSPDVVSFLKAEAEKLEEFKQSEGKAVVNDAADLLKQFVRQFKTVSGNLRKPNVLLTGITGAGKSSLINCLFGKDVAATGTGVPITQHFTKYEDNDMRVVIYDSKGLEHGQFENFIDTTSEFFDDHKIGTHGESNDAIHVVWYIVNSAHSRFEPFEEMLCRELFNRAPLMFLLNKADISTKDDRARFRKMITDLRLPNCVGVFDTVARKSTSQLQSFDHCLSCGSDDIVIRRKKRLMVCDDCDHEESLQLSNGLDDMISATCRVLPEVVRDAFVSAQNVSFMLKETSSRVIIEDFYNEFDHVRTHAKLLKIVAKMMARLSIVWEFKKHGHIYGATIARDLVSSFTLKDRMNLLFHKKTHQQRVHVSALGILWNRCLRNLAMSLFRAWDEHAYEESDSTSTCKSLFDEIFSAMNQEQLEEIEYNITEFNMKMVLDQEVHLSEQFRDKYSETNKEGAPSNLSSPSMPSYKASSPKHHHHHTSHNHSSHHHSHHHHHKSHHRSHDRSERSHRSHHSDKDSDGNRMTKVH